MKKRIAGKLKNTRGFTLAEVLIVIAIILILAGFGFVNVINNQRRLRLREMDDIARQIFIAAQNHLTVAEASGQWDYAARTNRGTALSGADASKLPGKITGDDGTAEPLKNENDRYYYITQEDYIAAKTNPSNPAACILPPGSIDPTIADFHQYVIIYDAKTATINNVFYTTAEEPGVSKSILDYSSVLPLVYSGGKIVSEDRSFRNQRIKLMTNKTMPGWYGPAETDELDNTGLYRPIVTVDNRESLVLNVIDRNEHDYLAGAKTQVKIIFEGLTSKATLESPLIVKASRMADPSDPSEGNPDFMENEDPLKAFWSAVSGPYQGTENKAWAYSFYLDSVTKQNGHFADIFGSSGFIPGEDISITVSIIKEVNGSSKESKSTVVTTNSLFGSLSASGTDNTVTIANGRHLQNLSYDISHVGYKNETDPSGAADLSINKASIIDSIIWKNDSEGPAGFINSFGDGDDQSIYYTETGDDDQVAVYALGASGANQGIEQFSAIRNNSLMELNGHKNELVNFDIIENPSKDGAGLIAKVTDQDLSIMNLVMINPTVTASAADSAAGAFVGSFTPEDASVDLTLTSCAVYNAAYDSSSKKWDKLYDNTQLQNISASNGNAGGLIGSMSAGTITKCAAALYVNASGSGNNAGGLVGICTGTVKIEDSYSAGHTAGSTGADIDLIGWYENVTTETIRGHYNVISAGGAAGGLVGSYTGGEIKNSYSTCSASGNSSAGGLIGSLSGGTIKNSYCTGLVGSEAASASKGQFIGTGSLGSGSSGNNYFSIINNDMKSIGGLGEGDPDPAGLSALDADLTSYNNFVMIGKADAADAGPYDGGLASLYDGKYALKTIKQLDSAVTDDDPEWLANHYGDWPAPETFVVNVAGS